MLGNFVRTHAKTIWQVGYLLTATSWLLAPYFNEIVSDRTTTISQFKLWDQPYGWVFAVCDILAGLLVVGVGIHLLRLRRSSWMTWAVLVAGLLMVIDSLAPTTCRVVAGHCEEYSTLASTIHNIESVLVIGIVLAVSLWYGLRRKHLGSFLFALASAVCAVLWVALQTDGTHFLTLTQYTYQMLATVWVAWWIGEQLTPVLPAQPHLRRDRLVRSGAAALAYANGVFILVLSLFHLDLLGFITNLYTTDTAWLAQYGVLVGLVMLYLSRQLARGEARARLLFLALLLVEVIKYAVIAPQPVLVALYGVSFLVLFCLKPLYGRGSLVLQWRQRLQTVTAVLSGIACALLVVAVAYAKDPTFARSVNQAFETLYTAATDSPLRADLHSTLLAHTIAALAIGFVVIVLWAIFRPARSRLEPENREADMRDAYLQVLQHSSSSEDYFKLWPPDKQYFWNDTRTGFVAYKTAGSVVFALAEPVAPSPAECEQLIESFVTYWQQRGYTTCFVMVQDQYLSAYKRHGLKSVQIGASAEIPAERFVATTLKVKKWRWLMHSGEKAGYQYAVAAPPHSQAFMQAMRQVSDSWLQRPGHREQGFAMGYFDESYLNQCRIHYLTDNTGAMIAFANELPVFGLRQATSDLIRFLPEARNAMPFLLARFIQQLHTEGQYEYFDLGLVPLAKIDNALADAVRLFGRSRYSAAGLEHFKDKFEPDWRNYYFVYDGDVADLAAIGANLESVMKPPQQPQT